MSSLHLPHLALVFTAHDGVAQALAKRIDVVLDLGRLDLVVGL